MITVVTPFKRKENLPFLIKAFHGKCHWIVLQATDEEVIDFPDWVDVRRYDVTNKRSISNRLFNEFIAHGVEDDTQYILLNDDDSIEEGFFDKIPSAPVVCVSMKRNDVPNKHIVWDNWKSKSCHWEDGIDVLIAHPDNMKVARVGGEQLIVKGYVLRNYRYGIDDSSADMPGDAKFVMNVLEEYEPVYVPDAYVLFNYFEDGRFKSFRRKPLVLFIGDMYCAGVMSMGKSEWEGNIWASLESTGLVDIARFHMDEYYYHYGKRGDEALLEAIERIKPDLVIMIIYKIPASDPTVISLDTIKAIKVPIISIWGDLEDIDQRKLAKLLEPHMKIYGTASKETVESLGYTYMHVPKDPRVFNNPKKRRDLKVVFFGSYGRGREDRQEVLNYLVEKGISLTHGGSEGKDHYSTEDYADGYKRAKIAIGFSQARGVNVVNARAFEVMLCGAMLLEQESPELAKLYTPYVDYVPWKDKEDLLGKIRYYSMNAKKRRDIASSGQKKTEALYSAKTFWENVL